MDPSAPSSVQSLKVVDAMAFPAPEPGGDQGGGLPAGGAQLHMLAEMIHGMLEWMPANR
jgi:hypothetical protein